MREDVKKKIQDFLIKTVPRLDTECPTNLSLSDLGKIIEKVKIDSIKNKHFQLMKQPYVKFVVYELLYDCQNKEDFYMLSEFLITVFLIQLFKRYIKFCNKERLALAIASLRTSHLFKDGLDSFVEQLSEKVTTRYYNKVDEQNVYKYVYEARHRVAQSLKSLVSQYLKITPSQQKDCRTIAANTTQMIVLYGLQVDNDTIYFKSDNDLLETVLYYLCKKDKTNASKYLAMLFKSEKISNPSKKQKITKALIKLVQ